MGEGNAAQAARSSSSRSCRRGPGGGCGLALGRLVRRLRRRSKMLCTAARPAPAAASRYCHQYDPLSYARNFDGTGLHDADDVSATLTTTTPSRRVSCSPPLTPGDSSSRHARH
uniref:Uncharacterized protein n=1 Tax=Avena sativa TaxID=4498 RepID=A0ACD5ZCI3_AVESA